ncbi:solute carrier family 46 member 2 [Syngnathoides biaculeatus]|uniref:solute carrier family 46 member 2 n=1 Tax=Syngnathoides biaculeatus TaxID=300417 RepID=UPI002ADD6CF0|nr:solute carrier family 46 member 2 [Syngnathoides biaculeatus]XP_061657132.1 solute carrier family 46 member 2 [Syngnathoides biaculeatus]
MSSWCRSAFGVVGRVEPLVVLEQLGTSLFDTALLMVVKDRYADPTHPGTGARLSGEDEQQKAISDFYMVTNLIAQLTPIVPALLLAKAGDRGWRRVPVVVPLCGYLLSSVALLLVVLLGLPIQVMFGAAGILGITGGFCAYWPGVMTLASLASNTENRSQVMMRVELMYGAAGLLGSLLSGHVFLLYSSRVGHGTVLLCVCTLLHLLSLMHSTVLLQVREASSQPDESSALLPHASNGVPSETSSRKNTVNVVLLFSAAILYGSAVGGAVEILAIFVIKEPLQWNAAQVGYGNAAGFVIFLTSFLGAVAFRRCVSDVALILIGMLSFATGIYFMSFVIASYMFYIARSLGLFGLIPLPTIRSLLSQQVPSSLCGITLTTLQLALRLAALAYIPVFTKLYQRTLGWFPGFVFTLSSVVAVLGMIPISVVGCRWSRHRDSEETGATTEVRNADEDD